MNNWRSFPTYKKLWSLIGGRPWTYISRDIYHKFEYVVLVSLFSAGFFIGNANILTWKWFFICVGIYTLGFIHGHFFWGKDYIENQQGE